MTKYSLLDWKFVPEYGYQTVCFEIKKKTWFFKPVVLKIVRDDLTFKQRNLDSQFFGQRVWGFRNRLTREAVDRKSELQLFLEIQYDRLLSSGKMYEVKL